LGTGFLTFAASANDATSLALTPMWYLALGYFILTVGELFISPIGLSKMTELSPPKYLAFIMGVFFTSSFYGHFFAGKIAKLTTVQAGEVNVFSQGILGSITEFISGLSPNVAFEGSNEMVQLYSYVSVYASFGLLSCCIGIFAILISPIIKKLMCGVH